MFVAAIISTAYGLVMIAVITGIAINIVQDSWLSPSAIFLLLYSLHILIAGFLHPTEIVCVFYSVIYYVTLPSMYVILIIYSLFNLNDITWGTRELRVKKSLAVNHTNPTNLLIYCAVEFFFFDFCTYRVACIIYIINLLSCFGNRNSNRRKKKPKKRNVKQNKKLSWVFFKMELATTMPIKDPSKFLWPVYLNVCCALMANLPTRNNN